MKYAILLLALPSLASAASIDSTTVSVLNDVSKSCGNSQLAHSQEFFNLPHTGDYLEVAGDQSFDSKPTVAGVLDIYSDLKILMNEAKYRSLSIGEVNDAAAQFSAVCISVQVKTAYQADGSKLGDAGFLLRAKQEMLDARHSATLFLLKQGAAVFTEPKYAKDRYAPACVASLARASSQLKTQYASVTQGIS